VRPLVCVVGSINVDRVVPVRTLPAPGATVIGLEPARLGPGGKGANQAAAAAAYVQRPGAVTMVGAVGADDRMSLDDLAGRGIATELVRRVEGVSTGHATVVLDADSQNLIVVDPGANAVLGPDDVRVDQVREAAVVLLQLEVPVDTVVAAAEHAGGLVVLNPAPAHPRALEVPADVLVPNRGELAELLGVAEAASVEGVLAQVRALPFAGAVVVTMGGDGALVVDGPVVEHVTAPAVVPVDTTGAGDCFCGVLAVSLASGATLADAARVAVRAASESVTRPGAR
jgi:ribokinase